MTNWLQRARSELAKKAVAHTDNRDARTPSGPQEVLSSLSSAPHPSVSQAQAANDADGARHWRFQATWTDGSRCELRTLPEATVAEAGELWPTADLEPLPEMDPPRREPTEAESAQIRALLDEQVHHDHDDYPEALALALRDPDAAMEAWGKGGRR